MQQAMCSGSRPGNSVKEIVIEGIDYQATYARSAPLGHSWLELAIAAKYDLEIQQTHFCTALLGVDLEEEVYMHPPQGYVHLVPGSRY
jgi:hypothetical protein